MCKQKSPTYIYPQIVKHNHATIETHSYWEPKPNFINFQERVEITFYKIWNKYYLQRCSGLLHDKENSWPKYYWKQKAILSKWHEKELQNDLLPQLVTQNCSSHWKFKPLVLYSSCSLDKLKLRNYYMIKLNILARGTDKLRRNCIFMTHQ